MPSDIESMIWNPLPHILLEACSASTVCVAQRSFTSEGCRKRPGSEITCTRSVNTCTTALTLCSLQLYPATLCKYP